jgi:hypothetical protein
MKQKSRLVFLAVAAVLSWAAVPRLQAQAEVAQHTWNNTHGFPVRFRIPAGQNIHQTVLYLETGEAQSGISFTLYGPNQTSGTIIVPGTVALPNSYAFSYTVDSSSESSAIKFHQTTTAGYYVLRIRHEPTSIYASVDREEIWVLNTSEIADNTSHSVTAYVGSQTDGEFSENPSWADINQTRVMINRPPVISNLAPANGASLLACRPEPFSATVAFADLDPVTRTWDFGDSNTSNQVSLMYDYANVATDTVCTVTLTVKETLLDFLTDEDIVQEASGQVSLTVNNNPAPSVTIQKKLPSDADYSDGPSTLYVPVGTTVQFRAAVTDDDRDAISKTWTLPDGSTPSGEGVDYSFDSASCSPVDVRVLVSDLCNQQNSSSLGVVAKELPTAQIAVQHPDTGLPAEPYGDVPLRRTFSGAGSTDSCGESLSFYWNIDSVPVPDTPTSFTQDFSNPGVYAVGLKAADPHGLEGSNSVEVYVLPNEMVRFPAHIGVPYDGDPPAIDGEARNDTGWRGALRLAYQGGTYPMMVFQGIRHRSLEYLYLAFEIRGDIAPNQYDVIVIGIRPSNQKMASGPSVDDRLIRIHPFGTSGNPEIEFLQGTGDAWQSGGAPTAAGDEASIGYRLAVSPAADDISPKWTVELRLPTSPGTGWITVPQDFLFYFNVFQSLTNDPSPQYAQYPFPRTSPEVTGPPDLASQPFLPRWWGKADKIGTAVARGVWFRDWLDVGTTSADPEDTTATLSSVFSFDQDNPAANAIVNTIVARVHNDTANEVIQGTTVVLEPQTAEQVRVRFRIANWGVPGATGWAEIEEDAGSENPTAYEDVAAGQIDPSNAEHIIPHDEAYHMRWTLDQQEIGRYTTVQGDDQFNEAHQCILAEIESRGNTNIVTASVHRNMNFQGASRFRHKALISTRGSGAAPKGKAAHRILLIVTPNTWTREKKRDSRLMKAVTERGTLSEVSLAAPGDLPVHPEQQDRAPEGYLQWVVNAYRYTDRTLVIDGKEHALVESLGSFGYIVRHEGFVKSWKQRIREAERIQENVYTLDIPPESERRIGIQIQAKDYPWFTGQRGGYAHPIGAFAADFGIGWHLHADFGYELWDRLHLLCRVGYSYFPALRAVLGPSSGVTLHLDPRYRIPLFWPFSLFVTGGPGVFLTAGGASLLDLNLALGFDWRLTRHLSLEVEAGYQVAFGGGPQFIYVNAGMVQHF